MFAFDLDDARDADLVVGQDVFVGEQHPFGFARRAGGVDQGGHIVFTYLGGAPVHRFLQGRVVAFAQEVFQRGKVSRRVEDVDALQGVHLMADFIGFGVEVLAGHKAQAYRAVLENILEIFLGQRRIDRDGDRSGFGDGLVEHTPFYAVGGDDAHPVAFFDPGRYQGARCPVDAFDVLAGGNAFPFAACPVGQRSIQIVPIPLVNRNVEDSFYLIQVVHKSSLV